MFGVLQLKFPESFVLFLKGLLMGMADIIPGVSGGTMALITGIYERLIHSIRDIDFKFISYFLKRDFKAAKKNFLAIDFPFLIPLGAGIAAALIILAEVIRYLLDYHTAPTYAFFFGLILASAGIVSRYVERIDKNHLISGIIGFVFVFVIVGFEEIGENHSPAAIFFSGAIAICAMILPGISGSLILLVIGQYDYMLNAFTDRDIPDLATFAAGAFIGIVMFSRLLDHMIRHHRSMTMAFLFGLMLGALRVPIEKVGGDADTGVMAEMGLVLVAAVAGFIMVALIEWKSMGSGEDGFPKKQVHDLDTEKDPRDSYGISDEAECEKVELKGGQ